MDGTEVLTLPLIVWLTFDPGVFRGSNSSSGRILTSPTPVQRESAALSSSALLTVTQYGQCALRLFFFNTGDLQSLSAKLHDGKHLRHGSMILTLKFS